MSDKLDHFVIDAINARIQSLFADADSKSSKSSAQTDIASASRAVPLLPTAADNSGSEFDGDRYGSDDGFGDDTDFTSETFTAPGSRTAVSRPCTTTHRIKSCTRVLVPSDVSEDLDVEFLNLKRRHQFPPYGITVKAAQTSTYYAVKFIECTFDCYDGTIFDDCFLEDVIFTKCHFRGSSMVELIAKGARFTGCVFGQTYLEGITLVEDAVIVNQSFVSELVVRGAASDNICSINNSAIQEFEITKKCKGQLPRSVGWANGKDNKPVQGDGQLVETPAYAAWENKISKPAATGDLMTFEEGEAQARARNMALEQKNGLMLPKNPNWDTQYIRQDPNAVKLVNHEIESAADAKTFAPTNFVKLDFDADPETRKEDVSDDFQIGKREYYGTKKNKSKRYWAQTKAEQQQNRRRNIPGAPHYF